MIDATTSAGDPVDVANTLSTYFTSADPTIAAVDRSTGFVAGRQVGHVKLYATTFSYGVEKRDSLEFVVNNPTGISVSAVQVTPVGSQTPIFTFFPATVTIRVGGIVNWFNESGADGTPVRPLDVVFDDPANVDSACVTFKGGFSFCDYAPPSGVGNIPNFQYDSTVFFSDARARSFPKAGTYHYHSDIYKTTGTVIVADVP